MSVFVSYSSQKEDFAELVRLKLENEGIEVWKDTGRIGAGTEWRNEIDQGIRNCDIVILLLNKEAAASPYVTYEWAFGIGSNKHIIPVLMEPCEIHSRISVLQHLDFSNRQRPWDILIARIKEIKGTEKKTRIKDLGDLTIEELEKLLAGSRDLATKNARDEERPVTNDEVAAFANRIVSAKNIFEASAQTDEEILWVDDRPENNVYEREVLGLIGFKFVLALSTNEALSLLAKKKYSAIISDMGRREGAREGYVLLKKVRELDKNTPFFIYAGSNSQAHKMEAYEKGAQGATNRSDELINLITQYVRKERTRF